MKDTNCKKTVLVSVYVVKPKPRRRIESANGDRSHHHHHYVHHVHHQASGGGYSRKAALLSYSQQLRAAARRGLASPRRKASPHRGSPARTKSQASSTVMVPLRPNPSKGKRTNAMVDWKKASNRLTAKKGRSNSMKKFQASMNKKMKAMMKSLRPKKMGFFQRLLFICGKPK